MTTSPEKQVELGEVAVRTLALRVARWCFGTGYTYLPSDRQRECRPKARRALDAIERQTPDAS